MTTVDQAQANRAAATPRDRGGRATSSSRRSSASSSASCSGPGTSCGPWSRPRPRSPPCSRILLYGVWLVPAVLAPLIIRKPGAALFAEMVAAGVSALLGQPVGPGRAALRVRPGRRRGAGLRDDAATGAGRSRSSALAAVASAAAAWIHDWALYYAGLSTFDLQVLRAGRHGDLGARCSSRGRVAAAIERSLRRAGVLEGFGGLSGGPEAAPPRSIRAAGAAFTYAGSPRPAFRDLELEVEPGAVLLVVGPSGSGKSTLARAIAGLLPSSSRATWQGSLRVGDVEVARRSIADGAAPEPMPSDAQPVTTAALGAGIVLQDPASQLVMERVGDDVAFGLENFAWPLDAMRARVPEALASVGLAGFEDRRSTRLSGGEQQRVALAGVLAPRAGRPRPRRADREPRPGRRRGGLRASSPSFASARAATIVLVEHRAELAWPLADVVLALDDDGRPIDLGPPAKVLERSGERMASGRDLAARGDADARPAASRARDEPRRADARDALPVLELRGVRFGYDRRRPVLRDVDLTRRAGRTGRARRGERQRQDDAAPPRARPSATDRRRRPARRARPGADAGRPARAPRGLRRPGSGARVPRPTRSARRSSSGSSPSRSATRTPCATTCGSRSRRSASGARTASPAASSAASRS